MRIFSLNLIQKLFYKHNIVRILLLIDRISINDIKRVTFYNATISSGSHHDLLGDHNSFQLTNIIFKIVLVDQFNDDDYDDVFVTFQIIPVFG